MTNRTHSPKSSRTSAENAGNTAEEPKSKSESSSVMPLDQNETIECVRIIRYKGPRRWLYRTLRASLHGTLLLPVGGRIETETFWPARYGEDPNFEEKHVPWLPWEMPDEIVQIRKTVDYLSGDETD